MSETGGGYATGDAAERMLRGLASRGGDEALEGLRRQELVLRGVLQGLMPALREFGEVPELVRAVYWVTTELGRTQLARSRRWSELHGRCERCAEVLAPALRARGEWVCRRCRGPAPRGRR